MGARPRALDLFAGIGLFSEGLHRAGFDTVAACEIDRRKRVLLADMLGPGVPIYADVTGLTGERVLRDVGPIDLVFGSPPCTDISSANPRGQGIDGEDSRLYFEAARLVRELRPRWACFENSPNLRARGADRVLDALERAGYACWPLVVGAFHAGAPHRRRRSWIVAADTDRHGLRHEPGRRDGADGQGPAEPVDHAAQPDRQGQQREPEHGQVAGVARGSVALHPFCRRYGICAAGELCDDIGNGCWLALHPDCAGPPDGFNYPDCRDLDPAEYWAAVERGDEPLDEGRLWVDAGDADGEHEATLRGLCGGADAERGGAVHADTQGERCGSGRLPGRAEPNNPVPAELPCDAPDPDGAGLAFWESLAGDHGPQLAALEREIGPVIHTWAGGLGGYLRLVDELPPKAARFVMSACGDAVVVELVEAIGRAILAADEVLRERAA